MDAAFDRKDWLKSVAIGCEVDAVLVTELKNIRWMTGFNGSNACLIYKDDQLHFLTDRRYENVVREQVKDAEVYIYPGGSYIEEIVRSELLLGISNCAVESNHISLGEYGKLKNAFPAIQFKELRDDFELARSIKDENELGQIKLAQALAEEAFEEILEVIKPGVSESEIAAEIVYLLLSKGAEKTSFDPIVASGSNGANPHAKPGNRLVEDGDLIVLDFGCVLNGYCSDMTRTVGVGEIEAEQIKVHQTVLDAMRSAIDHVKEGRPALEVDKVAREYIAHRGYARYFTHSTGHGVGLDIHESPRISSTSSERLSAGNVVTIEPGIYIPDQFGVRIEDMVHVTKGGSEVITKAARELILL